MLFLKYIEDVTAVTAVNAQDNRGRGGTERIRFGTEIAVTAVTVGTFANSIMQLACHRYPSPVRHRSSPAVTASSLHSEPLGFRILVREKWRIVS
jgi:hypothetical protein